MKALVLIATALFSFTATAGEYSKSTVLFQSASTYVPAYKVCRDGDVLKHKTKATIEVAYCKESDSGSESDCKIVSKPLVQPVVSTAQRCKTFTGSDNKDCAVWETYTLDQSSVNVWTAENRKEFEDGNYSLSGKYTIPACATGGGVAN